MIEDAVIFIEGNSCKTRLHEHGKEGKLFAGYIEGTNLSLTALKNSNTTKLEFHREGGIVKLTGIVWGEIQKMYDDHYVLHLEWEQDDRLLD